MTQFITIALNSFILPAFGITLDDSHLISFTFQWCLFQNSITIDTSTSIWEYPWGWYLGVGSPSHRLCASSDLLDTTKMIHPGDDTNSHFHKSLLHHILANRMLSDKMFCLSTGWVWMICLKYKVMCIDLKLSHQFSSVNFLMFKLVLEKAEEPEIKLPTPAGSWKKQERSRKNIYFCFIDYAKAFDCGSQ